jgi:nucleotide-binding universal stress UspA family protein
LSGAFPFALLDAEGKGDMSSTNALMVVALTWLVIGLLVAVVMRRRGFDFWVWLALGALLGPLSVPLAYERAVFHPVEYESTYRPKKAAGRLDVLAGFDGSTESVSAVRSALVLFGDSVTSVTLVTVLDRDSGASPAGAESQAEARQLLAQAAGEIGFEPVETELLFGRPDEAMAEYANERDFELIVVGARGHGVSETLFGSVTGRLVGGSGVPVLVGPRADVVAGRME